MNILNINLRRLSAGVVSAGLVSAAAAGFVSLSASAASIRGIINAEISEPSLNQGSLGTLKGTWSVPDGSHSGDTFSLSLDNNIFDLSLLNGRVTPMRDAKSGEEVGNFRVDSVSGQLLFTLSHFVEGKTGIGGTFVLGVNVRNNAPVGVTDGVFNTNTGPVYDPTPLVVREPVRGDYSNVGTKWSKSQSNGSLIQSFISGPVITEAMVGMTYTITDVMDDNQTLICSGGNAPALWLGGANINGWPTNAYWSDNLGGVSLTKTCDVASNTAKRSFVVNRTLVGKVPGFMVFSTPKADVKKISDTGVINIWGFDAYQPTATLYAMTDGSGWGETPPPTENPTEDPTGNPTDDPTTVGPTDEPTATDPPTDSPTTQPTTPVPTTTSGPPTTQPTTPVPTSTASPTASNTGGVPTTSPTSPPTKTNTPTPTGTTSTPPSGQAGGKGNSNAGGVPMVSRTFQVDRYRPRTSSDRVRIARMDDDRILKYREDKFMWGKSSWQIITVKVPVNATQSQVMKALNAKTNKYVGDMRTSAAIKTVPKNGITVGWELGRGATAKYPWGVNKNVSQKYFGRS